MVNPKEFEERFAKDWRTSFPNGDIERQHDITYGYKSINTVSDYICYNYPLMFYCECKAHKGASIPFSAIPQFERLIQKAGIPGVRAGVILFLYEKDKVFYIPATTIEQLIKDGKKSAGLKAVEEGYRIIDIPSKKLRTYMQSDYSVLMNTQEGE